MTVLRSGSASDVGRVRTINEDLAFESMTLFAVADGMGGHAGGEVASRTAIDALQQGFLHSPTADGLASAVRRANEVVYERSLQDADLRGMGTTLTVAALVAGEAGDRLVMANVGDSRSYRFHDGELIQLSHDHSVAEELVDRGELSEAEAAIHPHRHILTRALGVSDDVEVDLWQMTPEAGDRYLLCSDGLTNEVSETRIAKVLSSTRDPQKAAEALVRLANDNGGNDNVTVVVLDVVVGEEPSGDGAGAADLGTAGTPAAAAAAAAAAGVGTATAGAAAASDTTDATAHKASAPDTPAPSLLGRSPSDPAAGMRAMTARASEVSQRLRTRRITLRVLLFVVVLAAIVAVGFGVVRFYVDSSYFVKLSPGGQLVIYEGRMGGFLGFNPKPVDKTGIPASMVPEAYTSSVKDGVEEPSLKAAKAYVTRLVVIQRATQAQSQPPPTTSTTTTKPAGG